MNEKKSDPAAKQLIVKLNDQPDQQISEFGLVTPFIVQELDETHLLVTLECVNALRKQLEAEVGSFLYGFFSFSTILMVIWAGTLWICCYWLIIPLCLHLLIKINKTVRKEHIHIGCYIKNKVGFCVSTAISVQYSNLLLLCMIHTTSAMRWTEFVEAKLWEMFRANCNLEKEKNNWILWRVSHGDARALWAPLFERFS